MDDNEGDGWLELVGCEGRLKVWRIENFCLPGIKDQNFLGLQIFSSRTYHWQHRVKAAVTEFGALAIVMAYGRFVGLKQ